MKEINAHTEFNPDQGNSVEQIAEKLFPYNEAVVDGEEINKLSKQLVDRRRRDFTNGFYYCDENRKHLRALFIEAQQTIGELQEENDRLKLLLNSEQEPERSVATMPNSSNSPDQQTSLTPVSGWVKASEVIPFLKKYKEALDNIYNESDESREVVIKHFGIHHPPQVMEWLSESIPINPIKEEGEKLLERIVEAWEVLPGGQRHRPKDVEAWLLENMAPAINSIREFLQSKNKEGE